VLLDLLVRYSNHDDALRRVTGVLRRVEQDDQADEAGLPFAGPRPRGLATLSGDDVRQLVSSFRAGTAKRVLAERYGISESSVKRLLRRWQGVAT
jgi:hypothetical protein